MKRKDLLAKSLTLGLAVAMAASSMAVPGGMLNPVEVCADATDTENNAEVTLSGDAVKGETLTATLATENSDAAYEWYRVDANASTEGDLSENDKISNAESETYELTAEDVGKKIVVIVKASSGENADETGRAESEVVAYPALPDDSTVSFDGEETTEGTEKVYKDGVTITAKDSSSNDYSITDSLDNAVSASDTSYTFAKGDTDGEQTKTLYFKGNDDNVYQKDITIKFDVTAPTLSEISAPTGDALSDTTATLSLTSSEAGKIYYVYKTTSQENITADDITGASSDNDSKDATAGTAVTVSLSNLTANMTYYFYAVAEDEVGNLGDVESVSFTTKKAAFTGTVSINKDNQALTGVPIVEDELSAEVTGGASDNPQYNYQWYRVSDEGTKREISGATSQTYMVTTDDVGAKLVVEVSLSDDSCEPGVSSETAAVEKKTCEITLTAGSLFGDVSGEGDTRALAVTKPDTLGDNTLEYSLDGGSEWTGLTGDAITIGGTAYDANKIQVRVKETADTKASEAVSYATAIDGEPAKTQTVAAPIISGAENATTFTESLEVTITAEEGTTIYYTTDGSEPTAESTQYTQAFTITESLTVKAIAQKDGVSSEVASVSFTKKTSEEDPAPEKEKSVTPEISGVTPFETDTTVTIVATGAAIYYTTDGTDPTDASTKYEGAFTVNDTVDVKAIAYEDGKDPSEIATKSFEKKSTDNGSGSGNGGSGSGSGSGSSSGSSSGGGSSSGTGSGSSGGTSTDTTKPETETKPDGTVVTTTEEKTADGATTTQTTLKNDKTGVEATVTVSKAADGKVTEASAAVTQKVSGKTTAISATVVSQIVEAAGTKDVLITEKVVNESGKTVCKVTVKAADLTAGSQMAVLKINKTTGELTLINKSTYTVNADGSITLNDLKVANYMLVTKEAADAFSEDVLSTIKVESKKQTITDDEKTTFDLDDALNMANVSKITYTSNKKSVAAVNKKGVITAKKAGKVTIKAKVTLKNGATKTVKMTLVVKKNK